MAKGRRTPKAIKKLQGSVNATRDRGVEVAFAPVDGIPKPPNYFGEIARREWFDLLPQLKTAGTLERVDLPQLRLYCYSIQVAEECAQKLADDGYTETLTNKGGFSYEVPSPALKTMNDAIGVVTRVASKFGFDPVARLKVAAPKKQEEAKHPFEAAVDGVPMKAVK